MIDVVGVVVFAIVVLVAVYRLTRGSWDKQHVVGSILEPDEPLRVVGAVARGQGAAVAPAALRVASSALFVAGLGWALWAFWPGSAYVLGGLLWLAAVLALAGAADLVEARRMRAPGAVPAPARPRIVRSEP